MQHVHKTLRITARSLACEVKTLFSLPGAVYKLGQLLDSPYATQGEIAEVISNDPGLTARVLRLANYGVTLTSGIETVSGAVSLLSRTALHDLLVAATITSHFDGIPPECIDMERFWLNSVACGAIARSLAFRCGVLFSEPLFIAGLLHKVGRLVLYTLCPSEYHQVLGKTDHNEEALNQAEYETFGFTHAQVGAELLAHWGLPDRLQYAVAYYLSPSEAPLYKKSAALIHVASALACNIEPSVNLDEVIYNDKVGFEKGAWHLLGLPLHTIPLVLDEAWVQAFEIFDVLRPNPF